MIAIGTLCYLRGSHVRAGQTCTVIGPPGPYLVHLSRTEKRVFFVYPIELSSGESPAPCTGWAARPSQLVPITPPPGTIDAPERETADA